MSVISEKLNAWGGIDAEEAIRRLDLRLDNLVKVLGEAEGCRIDFCRQCDVLVDGDEETCENGHVNT